MRHGSVPPRREIFPAWTGATLGLRLERSGRASSERLEFAFATGNSPRATICVTAADVEDKSFTQALRALLLSRHAYRERGGSSHIIRMCSSLGLHNKGVS